LPASGWRSACARCRASRTSTPGAEASDRAERRDRQLAEIGEQLRAQTALLERIAQALEAGT
jgi:hypothetical protein